VKIVKALCAVLLLLVPTTACATTIIIEFEKDALIVAADSCAEDLNLLHGETVRYDQCKLAILGGQFIFASTGHEGYKRSDPKDTVVEWNSKDEAVRAYENSEHDLVKAADAWGAAVQQDFMALYLANMNRVQSLTLSDGTLLYGIFVGTNSEGKLSVCVVAVGLYAPNTLVPITHRFIDVSAQSPLFTTNPITRELADGKTDRAAPFAVAWQKESRGLSEKKKRIRWLEDLVEETSKYDTTVHSPTNIAKLTVQRTVWLSNQTCKQTRK